MDYAAVLAAAKKLDIDERTLLAWELWFGIEEEVRNAPLTEELKRELDRRLAEYEAHPERAVPWEEVHARVKERLARVGPDAPHIRGAKEDAQRTDP
jgi:putative addiction module component (TIGR02574 family)